MYGFTHLTAYKKIKFYLFLDLIPKFKESIIRKINGLIHEKSAE